MEIWDPYMVNNGVVGKVRDGKVIDQVSELIHQLKTNPDSRRMIISAWNVADLPEMHLMPCHCLFQFYTASSDSREEERKENYRVNCINAVLMYFLEFLLILHLMRCLTMMIAQVCDMDLGEFVHSFGDVHLYKNHFEQAELQLTRKPFPLPEMKINREVKNIFDFNYEDFELINYQSHPAIKAPVAV